MFNTDIDIDFVDKFAAQQGLPCISASMLDENKNRQQHPSGVYFQNIPTNPLDNLSAFDYKKAEELGYFKLDFLNLSIYDEVRDEKHLIELVRKEPDWFLLKIRSVVNNLAQISGYFHIVQKIQPKSVEDLAVVCALMRPGKKHLINEDRETIDSQIWKVGTDGYFYKKAHAIAYATTIVVQLNLLYEKTEKELDKKK